MELLGQNSAPRPNGELKGEQAVALRISGDKSAFYNCRLIGFQDTLCDDKGRHLFKDCYIEGTVDYIFGSGKSLYLVTLKKLTLRIKFFLKLDCVTVFLKKLVKNNLVSLKKLNRPCQLINP
jgi:pectinesterase